MAGLQVLEDQYKAQGLHVLSFFSNDFGNQGGSNGQIDDCTDQYNVTFDQFATDKVKGASAQPVFSWLFGQGATDPAWNFNKYLVGRDGSFIQQWPSSAYWGEDPNSTNFKDNEVVKAIEAELAKPAP